MIAQLVQTLAGASDKMVSQTKNVLLLPYPGFGHITPLLELARKIVALGHHATLAVSDNLLTDMRTRKMISPDEENIIHFIGLKDGVYHPAIDTLDLNLFKQFNIQLDASFQSYLRKMPTRSQPINGTEFPDLHSVDLVIVDLTFSDVPFRVCKERKIPVMAFAPFAAFMALQFLQITEDTPALPDEDAFKEMKPGTIIDSWKQQLLKAQRGLLLSDGLLLNSFRALEPTFSSDLVSLCPRFAHLKHGFLGPILPPDQTVNKEEHPDYHKIVSWLDKQEERSVIYFSFGSIAVANAKQIDEIFKALVGSKRPFVWSLRPAQQVHLPANVQDAIKRQFENPEVPYLILNWAPQKMILKHRSTRVFVSHCGWNSTMESISSGVPIVAWPMFADQHGDADLIVSSGCGLKIQQVDMSGQRIVEHKEILDMIDKVAQWEVPINQNKFFLTAQKLGTEAENAAAEGGDSARMLSSLLDSPGVGN